MKDAQLGNSKGLKNKMDTKIMNNELDLLLDMKLAKRSESIPDLSQPEVMSSLAKSLLKNSMNTRTQRMIQNK